MVEPATTHPATDTAPSFDRYGGSAPENYERYFVPAIGRPLAADLLHAAALQRGERVVDVACGTGVVALLAAVGVGESGAVAGVDINPGMLAVARSIASSGAPIAWHRADAASLPLSDDAHDVVLCQMGLQFLPDKLAALREARRVLVRGGRIAITVPGPTPLFFSAIEEALARRVSSEVAGFMRAVFSMHDAAELSQLLRDAGFEDVDARSATQTLRLPPAREFLWQYVHSTPLVAAVGKLDDAARAAFERDALAGWNATDNDRGLVLDLGMTTARARK
jgi:ubiquinone/menaquinone biosynthesis C-methylase UbiE